jgi:hypothetical protein
MADLDRERAALLAVAVDCLSFEVEYTRLLGKISALQLTESVVAHQISATRVLLWVGFPSLLCG